MTEECLMGVENATITDIEILLRTNICSCEYLSNDTIQQRFPIFCAKQDSFPTLVIYAYTLLFNTVIWLSVIGNVIVMWIVLCHDRMRTVTNYYLLNLAIADTSISILNTGFTWSYLVHYNWSWPVFYCSINNFMGVAPICASVFTMIVMSIDRYFAVVHPLRKRPGRKATVAVIGIIWIVSGVFAFPQAFASYDMHIFNFDEETGSLDEQVLCMADKFPDGHAGESLLAELYLHCLTVIQYIAPLTVLSFTYYKVAGVLNMNESVGEVRHYKNIAAKKKASKMLALVVAIFMIVWLPYHVFFLVTIILTIPHAHLIYLNVYLLGMSSSIFNPIIYYFMNKRFRTGFKYVFRWLPFIKVEEYEYDAQLGGRAYPRVPGASFVPSYNSASHTHTITTSLMNTDF